MSSGSHAQSKTLYVNHQQGVSSEMRTCMTFPKQAYWNSAPRPAWQEIHVSSFGHSGCNNALHYIGNALIASAWSE